MVTITKQCATEGCVAEIEQWQTYCGKHYAEMMAQQKQQQGQPVQPMQTQQPTIHQAQPVQPMQMQPPELPKSSLPIEPQQPVKQERYKIPEQIAETEYEEEIVNDERSVFDELSERDKIGIRQVAFNGAIALLSTMKTLENKSFEQLIGEVETLTNTFSNIIMTEYDG